MDVLLDSFRSKAGLTLTLITFEKSDSCPSAAGFI